MVRRFFLIIIMLTSAICSLASVTDKTTTPKDNKETKPSKKIFVTTKQLEDIIDKLSDTEKESILKVQKEIADWPKSLFDEISNYREFIIAARKLAQEKYNKLSPAAQQALESEQKLKSQLTPSTVEFLENVQLRTHQKTN